jgi:hypothetical protein
MTASGAADGMADGETAGDDAPEVFEAYAVGAVADGAPMDGAVVAAGAPHAATTLTIRNRIGPTIVRAIRFSS